MQVQFWPKKCENRFVIALQKEIIITVLKAIKHLRLKMTICSLEKWTSLRHLANGLNV